ncbi:MAG: hypothetical protein ACPLWB_03270 [Caldisericia bacterium]
MSKIEKIIKKIKRLPKEIDLEDVIKVLEYYGWKFESFGKRQSHKIY